MQINTIIIGLGKSFYLNNKYNTYTHSFSIKKYRKIFINKLLDKNYKKIQNAYKLMKCKYNNIKLSNIKNLQLIILSTPTKLHFKSLKKLLNNLAVKPKCILVEKPCGISLKEANKIQDLCRQKKIKIFVNYFRNYENYYLLIKKNFKNNSNISISYSGDFLNNASHFISLFVKVYGYPKKISVQKSLNFKKKKKEILINFNNKNQCVINKNANAAANHSFKIERKNKILVFNNLSHSITIKTKNKKTIKKNYEKSFINVYRNIYNFLNNKKYTCSNIDNAKKVHQIIDICQKKIKN